jgi:hypothetical protein
MWQLATEASGAAVECAGDLRATCGKREIVWAMRSFVWVFVLKAVVAGRTRLS